MRKFCFCLVNYSIDVFYMVTRPNTTNSIAFISSLNNSPALKFCSKDLKDYYDLHQNIYRQNGPPEGFRTLFSDLKGRRPSPSSPLGVYRLICTRMREVEPSSKNRCYQHHYQTALLPTAIFHTCSGKAHVTGICSELGRPG